MIVLPMAGLSERFFRAGYDKPKYMLDLGGSPVFDYALRSFRSRFDQEDFLIVCRREYDTPEFVSARLAANGVRATVVTLDAPTAGQAETVLLGLDRAEVADATPLTIFNIDSFRPGFAMTAQEYAAGGYLETFHGEGDAWSFVEPADDAPALARRVVEKMRISGECCTGLYYFRTAQLFRQAYADEQREPSQRLAEHYIAPMYNQLIARGMTVRYRTIPLDDVIFCGIPAEYEALLADPSPILPGRS
jgi:NDP-sugar pyrophosphorylase family protein